MMASRDLHMPQQKQATADQVAIMPVVLYLLEIGFLARLIVAGSTFLDPDEAFHYALGHQSSVAVAYRASFTIQHPPLLILLIYFLRGLGNSPIILRLPSVLAGGLSCWFVYKWLSRIASGSVALTGLALLALSPPLFALEAELRQYSFLLLFISAALSYFEDAIKENSRDKMVLFSLSLVLALTSHYSALIFAVAMGVYALLRFFETRPRVSLLAIWLFGQIAFLALALFLYENHMPAAEQGISDSWLRRSFYHPGDDIVRFLLTNTYRFFHYFFGQPVIGSIMLLSFLIGLFTLMRTSQTRLVAFRRVAWVIVLALLVSWTLSIADLYPFGGTRHEVFLLPFIVLVIAVGLATILGRYAGAAPLIAALAMTACSLFPVPTGPHISPPNQNTRLMSHAVQFVQGQAASGALVLVDGQSVFPFRYYFCRDVIFAWRQNLTNFSCGGYRVHKSTAEWDFTAEHLDADLRDTRAAFGADTTARIFVFQTGWNVAERNLRDKLRALGCNINPSFGPNILACVVQ